MSDPSLSRAAGNSKPQTPDAKLVLAALAAGFIAITAQSLIIRELVIAFLGNELVIGVTLGAWLLWTAVGSATLGRLGERSAPHQTGAWLATELLLLAVLLPLSFLVVGQVRSLAGLSLGEISGPIAMIGSCFAVLCPLCVLNGSIFPTLCRVASERLAHDAAVARVYVWEAVGSALGGILFAVLVTRIDQPVQAVLICSAVAVALAMAVLAKRRTFAVVAAVLALAAAALLSLWAVDRSAHVNTIYGRTTADRLRETTRLYHNGRLTSTYPLAGEAERLVHLALLQVPEPRRALLIGGLGGTAEEALKYAGVAVDVVELDPGSVDFARRHKPPSSLDAALEGGRARLIFEDGRRYVMRHRGEPYDAIIVDLPEPVTAQLNRYYTVEFFRSAKGILSPGGVLAFRVESADNLATEEVRDFLACLKRTLELAFEYVVIEPGSYDIFLAADPLPPGGPAETGPEPEGADDDILAQFLDDFGGGDPDRGHLTLDRRRLEAELERRHIRTGQFADETLRDPSIVQKASTRQEVLAESPSHRINTDLHPISYSYGLLMWTAKQRTPRSETSQALIDVPIRWLSAFGAWSPGRRWAAALLVVVVCTILLFLVRPRRSSAAAFAVGCSGFTEIAVTIIALLTFQALYGYVYAMLGLVLASFMIGLCVGGACASRAIRSRRPEFPWLLGTQAMLAAYPLVLIGVVWIAGAAAATGWLVAGAFLALTFVAGLTGGMQFPLAASVTGGRAGHAAAKLSALDLFGAAVGAITVSTFLIPAVGFVSLAVLLSGIGLVAFIGLCVARRPERP